MGGGGIFTLRTRTCAGNLSTSSRPAQVTNTTASASHACTAWETLYLQLAGPGLRRGAGGHTGLQGLLQRGHAKGKPSLGCSHSRCTCFPARV